MQMSGYLMSPAVDDRVIETARFGERTAPEPRGRHGRAIATASDRSKDVTRRRGERIAEYERSVERGHDDEYRAQIFPFCVRRQLAAVEMLVTRQKCWFTCGRLAECSGRLPHRFTSGNRVACSTVSPVKKEPGPSFGTGLSPW
jgi:hypothetical protein